MAAGPNSGAFKKIVSLDGEYTASVNPTPVATQVVRTDTVIQQWAVEKVGDENFLLRVEGYSYTGVSASNDKVMVSYNSSDDVEWEIIRRGSAGIYTIGLVNDTAGRVWTIVPGSDEIWIKPFDPNSPNQLFVFVPSD